MANDGKTMSDLFMSLMQGLDDDDEKKKRGFIPGTSIPMPDPNSLIPPVLDQFQTPPPKAPYQDAGEYMSAYREANKEAIDAIPRKDMLRSDGSTKSAQGYLGAFPDKYGKMMTEQTIGVEIDGKEVQMPAIVPTTTPDEIELLGSGNVNWKSPRGQLIQDKAVANYRDRMSKGLNPYYQDGETVAQDVPPVQNVPQPTSAPVPSGQNVPKPNTPEETIKEVTLVDDGLGQEYKIPFSEVERIVNKASQFEFGGKKPDDDTLRYLYDSSGRDPRVFDAFKSKYKYELKEKDSAGGFRPLITKVEENIEESTRKRLEEQKKHNEFVKGQRVNSLTQQAEDLGFDLVSKDVPPVDGAGIPKKDDAANQAGIDNIIKGMQAEQDKEKGLDDLIRRFEEDSTNLTKEDVNNAGSELDPKVKEQVDNSISQADFPRGMMGDDGEIFDNANPDDIPKKSEGVFKSLWNGIKDIAKEGFEDPALRRALFAYTASKVLGYDGVTLATGVLENEWQKQSAQLKAERESAIEEAKYKRERSDALFDNNVKFQQDVILKQIDNNAELTKEEKKNQVDFNTYDLISPKTFYNTGNRTNHVGAVNKPGTHVKFNEDVLVSQLDDNGDAVQVRIPMGAPVPIASLTNYGVTVGKGITGSEITDTYSKKFNDRMTKYKSDVFNMKSFTELPEAKQEDIKAQLSVIGGNVYELVETVLSTMPKGTVDTNEKGFTSAIERAAQVVVDDVVSGRSKNNAEIVSSIISERLTFDFRAMRLMGSDFKITNKDHKDKKIGLNSLTGILDKTSKAAQDLPNYRDKYDVLSELSAVYGSLDSKAKEKYEANSLNSLDDKEFPERYKTPFMSYVELKFDDNPQETMTILRNRRSK